MWRRSQKQEIEKRPSLILSAQDGTPIVTFPAEVVDPLRQMSARVSRNQAFPKRLALMASLREEGVTYLSQALATTLANDMEVSVCLVELNWWWPSDILATDERGGLTAVLTGESALDEALIPTGLPNLALLPAGQMDIEKRAMFARSSILQKTLEQLDEKFDHIILDIPAILATHDAIPLASLGTAASLIVRQGITSVEDARLALDDVDHLFILGVVMNQVELKTPNALLKYIPQH